MRKAVIQVIVTRGWVTLAGIVSGVLTARFLGAADRGLYFFGATLAALAAQFGNLGMHSANTYFASRNSGLQRVLNWHSVLVSVLGLGPVALAGAFFLPWSHWFPAVPLRVILIGLLLGVPTLYLLFSLNTLVAVGRIRAMNMLEAVPPVALLALMAAAGYVGAGPVTFLGASLVVGVGTAFVASFMIGFPRPLQADAGLLKEQFAFGARAYWVALMGYLVFRTNVLVVGHFHDNADLGIFSIAAQIGDALGVLPTAIALILFPELVRDARTRKGRMFSVLRRVALAMLVLCLVALLLSRPAISLLFGREYLPAFTILLFRLPGVYFLALTTIVSQFLAAESFPRPLLIAWTTAATLGTAITVLAVQRFGLHGAAAAQSIVYAALCLWMIAYASRHSESRGLVL